MPHPSGSQRLRRKKKRSINDILRFTSDQIVRKEHKPVLLDRKLNRLFKTITLAGELALSIRLLTEGNRKCIEVSIDRRPNSFMPTKVQLVPHLCRRAFWPPGRTCPSDGRASRTARWAARRSPRETASRRLPRPSSNRAMRTSDWLLENKSS